MTESNEEILRLLRRSDVPAAFQLSAQAGWNQTEEDWCTLLDLAPTTCFGIEIGGDLTSTTTLICYGRTLGWIGMVLTKAEFRRRGLARKLLDHTLSVADNMGIETLKLDATDQGQPLYWQCGFRGEHPIERWSRPGANTESVSMAQTSSRARCEQDLKYFGADRSPLLKRLAQPGSPLLHDDAYLFARLGRTTAYLGPCMSSNPEDAKILISACVEETHYSWSWDLFPENVNAIRIARGLGFTSQRHLLRMARGKELTQDIEATYAIAGFELG
jgi:GNAT superfamily N-acetyltransferase